MGRASLNSITFWVAGSTLRRYVLCCLLLAAVLFVLSRPVQAQLLTGTYTGDDALNRAITQLGFQPDGVIIKGDVVERAVCRTSTMTSNNAKPMVTSTALVADRIQSLDSNGFTIGKEVEVNQNGIAYYWVAFKAVNGELAVGSYSGDGNDNRTIDISNTSASSDFQPDYVIVMSEGAHLTVHRSSAMPGDTSFGFNFSSPLADRIQVLNPNGFEVGTNPHVNNSGTTYHYIAWKAIAGQMQVGSYTGDGMDNRSISGVGFQPEYLIVEVEDDTAGAVQKPASTGSSTDLALTFDTKVGRADTLQALEANGFQVGTDKFANSDLTTYYWMAFSRQAPTAVTLRSFTATHHKDGVLLHWRTGLDVNNLGWHLYRDVNGERVKLTPELIAGSALMFGPGIQLNAGNAYMWWDPAGNDTDRYWLEDRDLDGQLTIHGPVTPVMTDKPPPSQRHSTLLSQVGSKQTARPKARATRPTRRGRHRSHRVGRPMATSLLTPLPGEISDPSPHAIQRHLAAAQALKLDIWESGWYRVTQAEFVAAGLAPNIDPRKLQLFVEGQPQAIVVTGEEDGRFDPQDAIEFYGVGLDTPWTDTQTYWLVAGSQPGKRVQLEPSQTQGTPASQSFPFTVERKDRALYLATVKNGEAANFFGAVVAQEPVEQMLALHHLDPTPPADAQLGVALQGVTTGVHHVIIQLNGHDVGTMTFPGQVREVVTFPIPQAWLQDGDNIMTLIPIDEEEVSVVDAIRLTYWHTYTADDDSLRFTVPSHNQVAITGFSQPDIRVVDITHPQSIRELSGNVEPQGTDYTVTVVADGEDERTLLAFTDAQVKQPAAIVANMPSRWHHQAHGADLVIISHEAFMDSVAPLKTVRESQGWHVVVIDVEDVYDEFNFGHKSPWALRSFLYRTTYHWLHPPRFVLLVGDASFDSRNYLELDDVDWVPTKLVETALLETASDDWLVDFDEDNVPELAIGRLPIQTVEEANTVVAKLVNYAQASNAGAWTREVLLVADDEDGFDFATASREVGALLPSHLMVEELFLDDTDTASLRRDLLTRLNEGKLLVTYIGHGSTEVWAGGELLTSADARALTNGERLPVVVSMTCLNGFFHDLYTESLAEALLKAEQGGAIAVWASSGLTRPNGQAVMNQELMRALFGEERLTLGEAIVRAKSTITDRDVQRTWLLFGDPTTLLK